jgi:hypothetical protein
MHKRTVAAYVSAVGAAAAVAVGTAVAVAAPSAPQLHIKFLATNPNANPIVIATGAIHARGRDIAINEHKDRVVFRNGSLLVRHSIVSQHDTGDRTTCYATHTEDGTYRIVGGSGAYAHARGRGIYDLKVQVVGCNQHKPPRIFMLQINAHGPLSM